MVELGGLDQGPDLCPDRRQFGRVHRRDLGVLVEQLFQAGDVAVALCAGHRRDEVIDQRGVHAPLRLAALAGIVDQERYINGMSPNAASGLQEADIAAVLPGSHSRFPCLPTWIIASAPNSSASQRYTAR
jgi:hypothetical protein